ncbi:MAG: hypothetical protein HYX51_01995 [Chloroflexi bacterium]|nr:hypothetical protein [Chloroflexota bacterium]
MPGLMKVGGAVALSVAVLVGHLGLVALAIAAGIDPSGAFVPFGVSYAIILERASKSWGTRKGWLWGIAGFVAGPFAAVVAVFCYVSRPAAGKSRLIGSMANDGRYV